MKQEEKDLLLKDLCARLPYGVHIHSYCPFDQDSVGSLYSLRECKGEIRINDLYYIEEVKPYLFPLSSMTEEQWKEITDIQIQESLKSLDSIDDSISNPLFSTDDLKTIEWCYANYIDIHNLIPMGLAIDATGLNIY